MQYLFWTSKVSEKWMASKNPLFRLLYIFLSFKQPLKANVSTVYHHGPKQTQIFYNIQEIHFNRNTGRHLIRHRKKFPGDNISKSSLCILSHWELKFTDFLYKCLKVHIWLTAVSQPMMWCLYQLWNLTKLSVTTKYRLQVYRNWRTQH